MKKRPSESCFLPPPSPARTRYMGHCAELSASLLLLLSFGDRRGRDRALKKRGTRALNEQSARNQSYGHTIDSAGSAQGAAMADKSRPRLMPSLAPDPFCRTDLSLPPCRAAGVSSASSVDREARSLARPTVFYSTSLGATHSDAATEGTRPCPSALTCFCRRGPSGRGGELSAEEKNETDAQYPSRETSHVAKWDVRTSSFSYRLSIW